MCDRLLDSVCRLCLKDNLSLKNIFTYRCYSGEILLELLEKLYDLKICEGDGFPSQVCVACLWRVLEFDMYRKNVKYAEAEFRNLLSRTNAESNDFSDEGTDKGTEFSAEREMNVASDLIHEVDNVSEVSIKDEIQIEEWEMPQDILTQKGIFEKIKNEAGQECLKETEYSVMDISEIEEGQQEAIHPEKDTLMISTGNILDHNYPENEVQTAELEELQSHESCNVFSSEYFPPMADVFENISSKNRSSVVMPSGISGKNKEMCVKSVKDDLLTEKKFFFSLKSKNYENSAKSGTSSSENAVQRKRKPLVCDVCKKSCDTKQNLGCHVRIHYDDRPFKCEKCGKSFKWERVKTVHELRHVKQQKENGRDKNRSTKKCYVCEICKKEYQSQKGLYYHAYVHKNKHLCTFCGKRCGRKADLNRHLRIHTNEKPFCCEVCKRTFNVKGNLKRHLTTHSDDRPFHCYLCDKTFKNKDLRSKHELSHLRSK